MNVCPTQITYHQTTSNTPIMNCFLIVEFRGALNYFIDSIKNTNTTRIVKSFLNIICIPSWIIYLICKILKIFLPLIFGITLSFLPLTLIVGGVVFTFCEIILEVNRLRACNKLFNKINHSKEIDKRIIDWNEKEKEYLIKQLGVNFIKKSINTINNNNIEKIEQCVKNQLSKIRILYLIGLTSLFIGTITFVLPFSATPLIIILAVISLVLAIYRCLAPKCYLNQPDNKLSFRHLIPMCIINKFLSKKEKPNEIEMTNFKA